MSAARDLDERERRELEATWSDEGGVLGWLGAVRHTTIGLRFIVTAFVFFALAGVLALLMRLQLARPEGHLLGPDRYNQFFTVHGSTMMFLFAVPVMQGMGVYLVPLMIGTRNLAFPRLAAYSYFLYVTGGALLYASLFMNFGPDVGWFAYVPLAGPAFDAGKRADTWAQMITFTELSSLGLAVNLIATVFKQRAPGMSLDRIPLFVWATLVTSFMVVFAMPAVMLASSCLALDRLVGTHFFNPAEGGDAILWQHLFWFFGHPEVYIIFLPALGMISSIVISSARRPIIGYLPMVLALVATAFIGFGLWVHHMFATTVPQIGASFFTAASILIAIPSGVQIFCWIATLAAGHRLRVETPLLFVIGFVAIFVIGGLTGVMLGSVPIDLQVHDTFFVVAHLHYVLIGGAVFPLLGAIFHWLPKMTGRLPSERIGRLSFGLVFVGFNLTFFPMHVLGLHGMTRRIYTYVPESGFAPLNLLATIGAFVLGLGLLVYLGNVVYTAYIGVPAGPDPWKADSLEWSTTSPPPPYGFEHIPVVRGRYARWAPERDDTVVTGLASNKPEVLLTTLLDAEPDHRAELPRHSLWPLALAVATAVTFIAVIFTPWGLPIGAVLAFGALAGWFWPRPPHKELLEVQP